MHRDDVDAVLAMLTKMADYRLEITVSVENTRFGLVQKTGNDDAVKGLLALSRVGFTSFREWFRGKRRGGYCGSSDARMFPVRAFNGTVLFW